MFKRQFDNESNKQDESSRFTNYAHGHWSHGSLTPFCVSVHWFNQKSVGYLFRSHAIAALVSSSYLEGWYCIRKDLKLGKASAYFSPPTVCIAISNSMKVSHYGSSVPVWLLWILQPRCVVSSASLTIDSGGLPREGLCAVGHCSIELPDRFGLHCTEFVLRAIMPGSSSTAEASQGRLSPSCFYFSTAFWLHLRQCRAPSAWAKGGSL